MGYIAIISAQVIVVLTMYSMQRAKILADRKNSAWASFGLEIMILPPMLLVAETKELTGMHPGIIAGCFVAMLLGFLAFSKGLKRLSS